MISKFLEKSTELLLTPRAVECSNANCTLEGFLFVELSFSHVQKISRDGAEVSQVGAFVVAVDADVVGALSVGLSWNQILRFASGFIHTLARSQGG